MAGSATVEFAVLAVLLVVPVTLAVPPAVRIYAAQTQARSAAAAAALQLAREGGGEGVAEQVVSRYWRSGGSPDVTVACRPACGTPGAVVRVRVAGAVPLAPAPGSVTVSYAHEQVADRFVPR